jgi:hypothetical protein
MRINGIVITGCVFGAMAMLPGASAAQRECVVPKLVPASYTWNFQREANQIFRDMEVDAEQARYHAEQLESMASRPDAVSWVTDVDQLDQIRTAVDDMGRQMCRLETIRRATEPWQRKAIDRISIDVARIAGATRNTLVFDGAHRGTLWLPAYRRYADNLYVQARILTKAAGNAAEYAKVDRQERALRKALNTKSPS